MTLSPDAHRQVHGGSQLRRGERLHTAALISPSGRFSLVNLGGGTRLYDNAGGEQLWAAPTRNTYGQAVLALGLDGSLAV